MLANKKILLATDFSEAADKAAEIAAQYAKVLQAEVVLLHIVPENTTPASGTHLHANFFLKEISQKLQSAADHLTSTYGVPASFVIKEGNIFDHIGEAAKETNSDFIFMATHGVHGIQHFIGSYAGKVIANSPVPVLVVQAGSQVTLPHRIMVQYDFYRQARLITEWAATFAKAFKASVGVIVDEEERDFPSRKIDMSLHDVNAKFDSEGITHATLYYPQDGKALSKAIVKDAAATHGSLLMINQGPKDGERGISKEQQILLSNSENLPVMIMNAV